MRAAFAVLFSGVLFVLSALVGQAQAGDYYRGGYYAPRTSGNVWYSSDCCYKKVVRHVRQVRYVRTEPVRRYSHYDAPRYTHYDAPRYRPTYYAPPPPRYRSSYYDEPRYTSYAPPRVQYTNYGYNSYAARDCYTRRTAVFDGRGGWVWATRRVCD